MTTIKSVCVYCASSSRVDPKYLKAASRLAEVLVEQKIHIVFGGGSVGLMGTLADKTLELGGRITGIMPHFMNDVEWAHKGLADLDFVVDMHERKKKFLDMSDAVIALPGGCGTLEELLEAMTWKRLGLFNKPIIIVNTDGYYDPLIQMLERSIEEQFMSPIHRSMYTIVARPEEVMLALENHEAWNSGAIRFINI
jgi:uncharacterized protein (TIGR00730 family)